MIKMIKANNPLLALDCLAQGIKLLTHPDLRKFMLIPLIINSLLYTSAFVLGYHTLSELIQQFIPESLHWLSWILWPLFFVAFTIAGLFSFAVIANLLASPFYGHLSAKVLQIMGEPLAVDKDIPWHIALTGEWQRIKYLLVRVLPLLVISIIPGLNLIAPLLWAVFAAWGMAMEFLSYPLDQHGLDFAGQRQFMRDRKLGVLCLGGLAGLGLTLPVVNFFIGQAAVIGATLYVLRTRDEGDVH